jgi:hypothetical protein
MAPRFRWLGWAMVLAGGVLLSAEGRPARAQTLNEGWNRLDPLYQRARPRFRGYLSGAEKFDSADKGQIEEIDLIAKHYAYGIYLNHEMVKPAETGRPSVIDRDFKEIDGYLNSFTQSKDREALQPLADVFRDKVRLRALEVLQFPQARPIHKLHNARLLAKVAVLGQGALADTLITVLKEPNQNDAVRYYVLRGLGTLLAQMQPMQTPPTPALTKEEQAKCAEALVDFLEQRKGPAKNAPPEEIDGFRLLRREAIRALAQIHTPAVSEKVRPALVLARFAGDDERIQPPPRIDERVEAAAGLARMQSGQDKQYQPDYAAGQIAKCIGAFAHLADKELANLKDKKEFQTRPWRVDAAQLKEALAALKTDSGQNAFVAKVADRGMQLLDYIIKGREVGSNEVTWWTSPESDPPSKELFRGVANSTVKPGQRDDEAPDK